MVDQEIFSCLQYYSKGKDGEMARKLLDRIGNSSIENDMKKFYDEKLEHLYSMRNSTVLKPKSIERNKLLIEIETLIDEVEFKRMKIEDESIMDLDEL